MLSKMAKSSSWSQIHKRLAEIIKILSSHQSLVIDILKSAFSCIDKRDYEKIEFIFDQLKVSRNRTWSRLSGPRSPGPGPTRSCGPYFQLFLGNGERKWK